MRRLLVVMGCWMVGTTTVQAKPVHLCGKEGQRVYVITPNLNARRPGETDAQAYARLVQETIDANVELQSQDCQAVETSELPTNRRNRNQWRMKGGKVDVPPVP